MADCVVQRVSYTGDLGYEIWMEPAYERRVYIALKEAGAAHGIRDFGMRALLSMRLEKNFPTWGHELRPIYGPFGDFSDPDGYTAGAKRGAALGIEGKWAIHPSQIELANDVFSPPPGPSRP